MNKLTSFFIRKTASAENPDDYACTKDIIGVRVFYTYRQADSYDSFLNVYPCLFLNIEYDNQCYVVRLNIQSLFEQYNGINSSLFSKYFSTSAFIIKYITSYIFCKNVRTYKDAEKRLGMFSSADANTDLPNTINITSFTLNDIPNTVDELNNVFSIADKSANETSGYARFYYYYIHSVNFLKENHENFTRITQKQTTPILNLCIAELLQQFVVILCQNPNDKASSKYNTFRWFEVITAYDLTQTESKNFLTRQKSKYNLQKTQTQPQDKVLLNLVLKLCNKENTSVCASDIKNTIDSYNSNLDTFMNVLSPLVSSPQQGGHQEYVRLKENGRTYKVVKKQNKKYIRYKNTLTQLKDLKGKYTRVR